MKYSKLLICNSLCLIASVVVILCSNMVSPTDPHHMRSFAAVCIFGLVCRFAFVVPICVQTAETPLSVKRLNVVQQNALILNIVVFSIPNYY